MQEGELNFQSCVWSVAVYPPHFLLILLSRCVFALLDFASAARLGFGAQPVLLRRSSTLEGECGPEASWGDRATVLTSLRVKACFEIQTKFWVLMIIQIKIMCSPFARI